MGDTSFKGNQKLGLLGGGPTSKDRGWQMVAAAQKRNKEKGMTKKTEVHPFHNLPPASPQSSTAATVSVSVPDHLPVPSPAPSVTPSLDQMFVGLLERKGDHILLLTKNLKNSTYPRF